jgi:hypothetical protein
MQVRYIVLVFALALAVPAFAPSAANAQVRITIGRRPPQLRREVRPPPPQEYAVWVQGYWTYDGRQYVWQPGSWQVVQQGHRYRQPRWIQRGNEWAFYEGRWVPDHRYSERERYWRYRRGGAYDGHRFDRERDARAERERIEAIDRQRAIELERQRAEAARAQEDQRLAEEFARRNEEARHRRDRGRRWDDQGRRHDQGG